MDTKKPFGSEPLYHIFLSLLIHDKRGPLLVFPCYYLIPSVATYFACSNRMTVFVQRFMEFTEGGILNILTGSEECSHGNWIEWQFSYDHSLQLPSPMASDSSPSDTPMVLTPDSTGSTSMSSSVPFPGTSKKARRQTAFYPNVNSSNKTQKPFSRSAAKRESVMALGSIEHLQHYFTKTGIAAKKK